MNRIESFARLLDDAALQRRPIAHISAAHELTLEEAYAIQDAWMALRAGRGDQGVGYKLGFTNTDRLAELGLSGPAVGVLTASMLLDNNSTVSLAGLHKPRIEPELAFLMGAPLEGQVTLSQVLDAVQAVAPAIEVVATRYSADTFSLLDVIADNCSAAAAIVGEWRDLPADLANLGVNLEFNGRVAQTSSTAAVMGHPGHALVSAVNTLAARGVGIKAGSIVLTGSATPPQPLQPGLHARVEIQQLGYVTARFE